MLHLAAVVAASILGIDVGWQPLPEGGVEYIIQIPPQTFEVLKPGDLVQSRVPAEVKDIRQCRVVIGRSALPRLLPRQSSSQSPLTSYSDSTSKQPLEHTAAAGGMVGQTDGSQTDSSEPVQQSDGDQHAASWWPTVVTLVALFASLGANVYLGWLTWELHRRCQAAAPSQSTGADQPEEQS